MPRNMWPRALHSEGVRSTPWLFFDLSSFFPDAIHVESAPTGHSGFDSDLVEESAWMSEACVQCLRDRGHVVKPPSRLLSSLAPAAHDG